MEYNDLILDMLNRIVKLENEVEKLKKICERQVETPSVIPTLVEERPQQRDKSRYLFNGDVYLKNRLVLAVLQDYVERHPEITCQDLKLQFYKSLQGSIGVVEKESDVKDSSRFFTGEKDILKLVDGNMLVCNQWGISNISNFVKHAEMLGYTIQKIER